MSSSSSCSDLSASDFHSTSSDITNIFTNGAARKRKYSKTVKKRKGGKTRLNEKYVAVIERGTSEQNKMDSSSESSASKRFPQYLAALSGSVAAGSVLGWTGTISESLQHSDLNGIPVDTDALGWISGFVTLGAMVICFPIGFICDGIGRKWACLLTIIPFSIGWALVIFSSGTLMIYIGRFLTGLAGGAFCVAAPLYTSEIAEKEIRGALGSYFQLLLTVGVLFSYVCGTVTTPKMLSILCAFIPIGFGVAFFFQPETPETRKVLCAAFSDSGAQIMIAKRN
ncbi:hypothetical protein HUJ05_011607 [Dendroctonus ponderosae]|nr:hypothetical protein HUJ05_011607 [Dendroctonus ponderosae]